MGYIIFDSSENKDNQLFLLDSLGVKFNSFALFIKNYFFFKSHK